MNDTSKLAELARQNNLDGLDAWPKGRLEEWLNWMDAAGALFACYPDQQSHDNPCGFAIIRPLRDLNNNHQRYRIDDNGETLYCDMAVAKNTATVRAIAASAVQRFGLRKWFANTKNGTVKIHNTINVLKALYRKH